MKFINRVNPVHPVKKGFSLTEVLIATGIMAIGLVMVATIFPVGVKLTTLTTERTIGAVVADEAFAKIQLYGLRDFQYWPSAWMEFAQGLPNYASADLATYDACDNFIYTTKLWGWGGDGFPWTADDRHYVNSSWEDFLYPSAAVPVGQDRNYNWSALCRRVGPKDVQVTVFVNRKIASGSYYQEWVFNPLPSPTYSVAVIPPGSVWPQPVPVNVTYNPAFPKQLTIAAGPGTLTAAVSVAFFGEGYTIVDSYSGRIYRVLEVDPATGILTLQQDWFVEPLKPAWLQDSIWVVPPAVNSDRYPCAGVYQKVIRFDNIN